VIFRVATILIVLCSVPASAGGVFDVTNEALFMKYFKSENRDQAMKEMELWVAGFSEAFEAIYILEKEVSASDTDTFHQCVTEYDPETLTLLLLDNGTEPQLKDMSAAHTLFLMLRISCDEEDILGPIPGWFESGDTELVENMLARLHE